MARAMFSDSLEKIPSEHHSQINEILLEKSDEIKNIDDLRFMSFYNGELYYTSVSGGLIWHKFMFTGIYVSNPLHIFKPNNYYVSGATAPFEIHSKLWEIAVPLTIEKIEKLVKIKSLNLNSELKNKINEETDLRCNLDTDSLEDDKIFKSISKQNIKNIIKEAPPFHEFNFEKTCFLPKGKNEEIVKNFTEIYKEPQHLKSAYNQLLLKCVVNSSNLLLKENFTPIFETILYSFPEKAYQPFYDITGIRLVNVEKFVLESNKTRKLYAFYFVNYEYKNRDYRGEIHGPIKKYTLLSYVAPVDKRYNLIYLDGLTFLKHKFINLEPLVNKMLDYYINDHIDPINIKTKNTFDHRGKLWRTDTRAVIWYAFIGEIFNNIYPSTDRYDGFDIDESISNDEIIINKFATPSPLKRTKTIKNVIEEIEERPPLLKNMDDEEPLDATKAPPLKRTNVYDPEEETLSAPPLRRTYAVHDSSLENKDTFIPKKYYSIPPRTRIDYSSDPSFKHKVAVEEDYSSFTDMDDDDDSSDSSLNLRDELFNY
jgi:hypothetical protein